MLKSISLKAFSFAFFSCATLIALPSLQAESVSHAQQSLQEASSQKKMSFIMFFRKDDASTRAMYKTLSEETSQLSNTSVVTINVTDQTESELVSRFDAGRLPLPAVVALAPNGAVSGVFSKNLKAVQVQNAIVSPIQAECIKALQDKKIVLLCAQPDNGAYVPKGVQEFQADPSFSLRTHVVNVRASDPIEADFLKLFKVSSSVSSPVTVFMAPPGKLLGVYTTDVSSKKLTETIVAAGACCTDPNCKHKK